VLLAAGLAALPPDEFRFVLLGDRTGEVRKGVYEQVWREAAAEDPAFVVTLGDTIQGHDDAKAEQQWHRWEQIVQPFRRIPLYLVPGNHDIWSTASERLYRRHSRRAPHYSFDYGPAHLTILDNSRTNELPADELAFLESDLKAHVTQPLKFVLMHRPSWLIRVALRSPDFLLHQLAKKYGVQYVISGHVHQMLRFELDGINYVSMPSAGGHLRASEEYELGWFFGYALVAVGNRNVVAFHISEAKPPHGKGRTTRLQDWGMLGLIRAAAARGPAG
jgi:predicted phosphodiesterase